jgi:hypothetical protein
MARQSRSGCLIAVYIIAAAVALIVVVVGLGAWLFLRSDTGQRVRRTVTEGIALTREATRAPGTEALRAGGCAQAMVIPAGRITELVGEFAPEARGDRPDTNPFADDIVVLCTLDTIDDTSPDCTRVARVYAGAVPEAPERFGVVVQGQGRGKVVCQGSYAPDGSRVDPPVERQ